VRKGAEDAVPTRNRGAGRDRVGTALRAFAHPTHGAVMLVSRAIVLVV
jgi:hypothetical protein